VQIGTEAEILLVPANNYVERFVEDVDLEKVFTAEHFMKRAENVTVDRGPQVALKLMRDNGVSTVFGVDRSHRLLGYVTADDASKAAKEKLALHDVLTTEIPTIHPDTLLADILEPMAEAIVPISVVDNAGTLL